MINEKDDGLRKMLESAFGIKNPKPPQLVPQTKPMIKKPAPVNTTARVFNRGNV